MIPKIIHYCWFGDKPLPKEVVDCIESWKRYCPDFEIILWNEKNFPIKEFYFSDGAYQAKKYAFVADVARIYALYKMGGIYMDTDMELIKPLDDLLNNNDAVIGFEDEVYLNSAFLAAKKDNEFINEILSKYKSINEVDFLNENETQVNSYIRYTIPKVIMDLLKNKKIKLDPLVITKIDNYCTFFPKEYFYPKNYKNGILKLTKNSYGIHHYDATWIDDKDNFFYYQKIKQINYHLDEINDITDDFDLVLMQLRRRYNKSYFDLLKSSCKNFFQSVSYLLKRKKK